MLSTGYMGSLLTANKNADFRLVHSVVVPWSLLTEFVPTVVFMIC